MYANLPSAHTHIHVVIGMNTYPNTMCDKGINVVFCLVVIIKTTPKKEISRYIYIFINIYVCQSIQHKIKKKKHECSNSN